MTRIRLLTGLLLVAGAATVTSASLAAPVGYLNFHSPSRQISCTWTKPPHEIECFAPYLHGKNLDAYLAVGSTGKARRDERGDYAGYGSGTSSVLRYGQVWQRRGVRCVMRQTGLTCRNRSHHGFHLAKGDIRLF